MTPVRYGAGVRIEALDLGDWFEAQMPGGGERFADELNAVLERLSWQPRSFARIEPRMKGREIRQGQTPKVPAVITYEVTDEAVLLLSVIHAHSIRNPWRKRLRPR